VFIDIIGRLDEIRVDIPELDENDTIGDKLSGGYIIKRDSFTGGGDGWTSSYSDSIIYQYHYPKYDVILPAQKEYIQNFIYQFETVMDGEDYADTVNGYPKYLNTESFIDFIISNELSKNIDAYRKSSYMFKDRDSTDGRLYTGPLWDYNIAYGNAFYFDGYTTTGWVIDNDSYITGFIPFWMRRIFNDSTFANKLKCRWMELRAGPLSHDNVIAKIDSCYNYLYEAQQRNFTRWQILGMQIWPNYFFGENYEEEVLILKLWLTSRLDWMDNNLPGHCETSGMSDNTLSHRRQLTLFPNPASKNTFSVEIPAISENGRLVIYNNTGQLVLNELINKSDRYKHREVNISNFTKGVYVVKIEAAMNSWVQKLIIE